MPAGALNPLPKLDRDLTLGKILIVAAKNSEELEYYGPAPESPWVRMIGPDGKMVLVNKRLLS